MTKRNILKKIKKLKDKDIFKQSFTRIEGEANNFEYDHIWIENNYQFHIIYWISARYIKFWSIGS